jgi:hypothetical protein
MDMPLIGGPTKSAAESRDLQNVPMLDLLRHDPRPTFVLDTTAILQGSESSFWPVYCNPALAAIHGGQTLATIQDKHHTNSTSEQRHALLEFRNWISSQHVGTRWTYAGHNWSKVLLTSGWVVVSASHIEMPHLSAPSQAEGAVLSKPTSRSKIPTFDWTDELPPLKMSSHVAWARSVNWSQTPLGHMSTWSSQLRSIANLVMQDPRPAVVFYGPDLIMIYNEAEIELLGGFHPCMGKSARVALASVWGEYFEPIIAQNLAGETVERTDTSIHMVRNGFMEETYFSLKFIPIFSSDGVTVGHYEPLIETVSVYLPN